jgi:hypothetical protein
MVEPVLEPKATLAIEAPPDVIAGIEEEARKYGLKPASYLLLLHGLHTGSVSPSFADAVREIFNHDREILRVLAK